MYTFEPPTYNNRFGMNEYLEEYFISSEIEKFCKAVLHLKNFNQDLYGLIYEYIQDNLEKFIPEGDHEQCI